MRFLACVSLALVALVANPLAETKIMRIVDHIHVGSPDRTKAAVVTLICDHAAARTAFQSGASVS